MRKSASRGAAIDRSRAREYIAALPPDVRHAKDLGGSEMSRGTLRFPLDTPLPIALVKRLVKTRLGELGLDLRKEGR